MRATWFVALACVALATSADAKRLHLRKPRHGFQMRMTSFVVQPGADREGCEYAVAPNRREHPSVTWYTTAKPIHAGEGLRFTCEWSNPDDHPVHFGVTTEDEMCFVGGYFYPDDDGATVSGPGCMPQGSGLECFVPNLPS